VSTRKGGTGREAAAHPDQSDGLGGDRIVRSRPAPGGPGFPGPFGSIDKSWRRVLRRAGFVPVGTHALRRSFGRISHGTGALTAEIQALYGHAAESTTSKYIGVDEQRMARGRAQMAAYFEEAR
jgi:integrase